MKTITVHVTQADIDAGKPWNPCECPVALAVKRATRRQRVEVREMGRVIRFFRDKTVRAPKCVADFVENFDGAERFAVKPFSFTIRI